MIDWVRRGASFTAGPFRAAARDSGEEPIWTPDRDACASKTRRRLGTTMHSYLRALSLARVVSSPPGRSILVGVRAQEEEKICALI
jgi:hypothetical protein